MHKKKKQMNCRVSLDVLKMRNDLVEKFNSNTEIGKISANEIVELAIRELYRQYFPTKCTRD